MMKLIIVDRSKYPTFQRLSDKFADDGNVMVIWDRRTKHIRQPQVPRAPERRSRERRRLVKPWNGKDYVVVNAIEPWKAELRKPK
jgi:hypothetical protein